MTLAESTTLTETAKPSDSVDRYKQYVTFLVGERVAEQGRLDWDSFVDSNPDLFEWPNGELSKRYPDEVLFSVLARQTFVMPPGHG